MRGSVGLMTWQVWLQVHRFFKVPGSVGFFFLLAFFFVKFFSYCF